MVNNPDEVKELRPEGRCACGCDLEGLPATLKERRQQIEIPEPRIIYTEFRRMQVVCGCGRCHLGEFPAGVTPNVSYGPRLKAYAIGLNQGHFVALERTSEILADQYGVAPSAGTLQNWILGIANGLEATYESTRDQIRQAPVAHFDESGLRVQGRLHWLHVAATTDSVYYTVHARRGHEAMDEAGILPHFKGVAVHDHWAPYWRYTGCEHMLCNAHHLRELNYSDELTGHLWPRLLRESLLQANEAVAQAKEQGLTHLPRDQIEAFLKAYDEQVAEGLAAKPPQVAEDGSRRRVKQHPATNLLLRLRDFRDAIWRFVTDWRVPFTNNLAERMVRPIKVKLKVIGGFRAMGGTRAFCIIRSVWETSKLRGQNPFEVLRVAATA
ncbi:IS66 family transposase [Ectothiorhodospira variabilis]|uniref:IS66 family transposase n=1 Tax=Ectothiorhodospira variabilis TaxID=505694 RepID=UPI001EFBF0B6|nr:IS66 family transposase [Ectothiorhodospira variabilis]MCG5498983.1 IS66 family transposase [Ectothiorhodospira variabilis]